MAESSTIEMVVNDAVTKYFQLIRNYDETALDLTASTTVITVKFRTKGNTDESIADITATKVLANLGVVSVAFTATHLDQTAGRFELEFTVTYDGDPETCLNIVPVKLKAEFPDAA